MNHNDNQETQTANPTGVEARLARHGGLSYLHLPAVDVHQSAAFYERVFGWKIHGRDTDHPGFDDRTGHVSGAWVLPLSMVDNSAFSPLNSHFSPTGLTVPSDSAYDEETFHATHIKQRGSLWPFICSCSCSWSASALWRCFGVLAGTIFNLPTHKQEADASSCPVCSNPALRLTALPAVSPALLRQPWDLPLRQYALGVR